MAQLAFDFSGPSTSWSGYGWIVYRGRRLFALVYDTWDFWFAKASENRILKRDLCGTLEKISFAELVEPLTVRADLAKDETT